MIRKLVLAISLVITTGHVFADATILPMQERAAVIDRWLTTRVQTVLPELMERADIDMWVIISREYNEDPVIRTMIPATWHSARRRTILLIHGEQWARLAEVIEERSPRRIGLNFSETFALADGITQSEYRLFHEALDPKLHDRVVSAEKLAIGWLETRTEEEMATYQNIVRIAHEILAEGLSEKVIQPGITTTGDVIWWYRDRIRELKLTTWFHPSVSVDRAAQPEIDMKAAISARHDDEIIMPGDLLHVDFGISYLRLNTDTQQHAYVLKPGESEAPAELREALARGNRLQDILTDQFITGRTGNEILASRAVVITRYIPTPLTPLSFMPRLTLRVGVRQCA